MQLDHYPPETLKREILLIIGRHLDLERYRVFFFGSRVTGRCTDRSDVDVGILGPAEVPTGVLGAIREEMEELPTIYTLDLVDFTTVSEAFRAVALAQTEPLT
jgi:predicted nucleotidyltransferase